MVGVVVGSRRGVSILNPGSILPSAQPLLYGGLDFQIKMVRELISFVVSW